MKAKLIDNLRNRFLYMKKPLITIALILIVTFIKAQSDTLFWFAVPEVTKNNNQNLDRPIALRITSYSQQATVTISKPASPGFTPQVVNVPADNLVSVDLTPWIDSLENKPADAILNYGLKIQSTKPVTIYYEVVSTYCNCNPEIFLLKGQNALGRDFWIPSQNIASNSQNYSPVTNSSFDIVASQKGTILTITPSQNIVGHPADSTFSIILNEGQTYSARATGNLPSQHLFGSRVTSNHPIAITIKDDVMTTPLYGSCADIGGEQIVPTNLLGTEYVAINGLLNNIGDQLFVLATEDNTLISQNGRVLGTINAGELKQLDVGDSATYIHSSAPTSVLQMSGMGCEIGLSVLPQLKCNGIDSVALARSTNEAFYINLVVAEGGQNDFLVNGASGIINGAIFKQVPGTNGEWLAAQMQLSTSVLPVGSSVIITNSSMPFQIGVLHGAQLTGSRFGYFSNYACVAPPDTSSPEPTKPDPSIPNPESPESDSLALAINKSGSLNDFSIYPNPATSALHIKFSTQINNTSIEIYNVIGERVNFVNSFNGSEATFNISELSKGLYFIKIAGKENTVVRKFVKE